MDERAQQAEGRRLGKLGAMNHIGKHQFFAGVAERFQDIAGAQHRLRFVAVTLALFSRPALEEVAAMDIPPYPTRHPKFRHTELTRLRSQLDDRMKGISKFRIAEHVKVIETADLSTSLLTA